MPVDLPGLLTSISAVATPLGWLVLGLFLVGILLDYVDRDYARPVLVVAWGVFALFWLVLIYPWFAIDNSFVRGLGAVLAVPLSVMVGKSLYEGRDSLITLSRAVAIMGLVYAPFVTITRLREWLIMRVTSDTAWAMGLIGRDPPLVTQREEAAPYAPEWFDASLSNPIDKSYAFENSFVFFQDGYTVTFTIILACTGLGSMAVIIGLVSAVRAPWRRKLRALGLAVPIIYLLNIVRNVFIATNYGEMNMQYLPEITMWLFGVSHEAQVSYIWADRIFAQIGSVIAMIIIFWLVMREVPEVLGPVEDVIYLLTGDEVDLAEAFDLELSAESPATSEPGS